MHHYTFIGLMPKEPCFIDSSIKVCSATHILVILNAVSTILLVELAGLFFVGRVYITAVFQEMPKPIVLFTVSCHCVTYALRVINLMV